MRSVCTRVPGQDMQKFLCGFLSQKKQNKTKKQQEGVSFTNSLTLGFQIAVGNTRLRTFPIVVRFFFGQRNTLQ